MGQYNKAVLTTAGENLIARALAGEIKLNFTKAKTSDFAYPYNADLKRLTDMQGVRQTVCDPETAILNETIIKTRVLFNNEDIASTYYIHNIGLYAMDGTQEILFSIVTAEMPDEMPQYNGVASTSYIYNIQNVVQDAPQLNITVNPSGTATIQDVLERVDAIGGDISETVIETLDTVESKYPVPSAGESVKRFFGKVLAFMKNIRPLTENINIYVSTTGSDILGDGTSGNPFKTIQHAIDIVPKDLNGYNATINVAAGTYSEDITIKAFRGGAFNLYSVNKDTLINTCIINSIDISVSSSYIRVNGFNIVATSRSAVKIYGCTNVIIAYCQSVVVSSFNGIESWESQCFVDHCKIANHNCATSYGNGIGTSSNWDSNGSTGNTTGLIATGGSRVTVFGTQPSGTTQMTQLYGGMFINANGTQISDDITAGLSCTWGTIRSGYVRHGNLNGAAMISINMRIEPKVALTAGTEYFITGLPPSNIPGYNTVPISIDAPSKTTQCFLYAGGTISFMPSVNVPLGAWNIAMSATYKTNS